MSGLRHDLGVAWRVLRAEGLRAAVDRARDRLHERRERRRATAAAPGGLGRAPVLNVLGMPLSPRWGGVPTQLRNRLAVESGDRPCAVLHPQGTGWRLEYRYKTERRFLARGDAPFEEALHWGMRETGAAGMHCEGVAGLDVQILGALARQGARLVISLHDFSIFGVGGRHEAREREKGALLLRSAEVVVFPSRFLRDACVDLVPGLDAGRLRVIEPGTPPVPTSVQTGRGEVRHVAWVGAVQVQKGALVFEEVVRQLRGAAPVLRWTALGGGDADLLARFRALPGVAVRGYWRAGSLPVVLRRLAVDMALLLSITPEAYGLTLDECWRAGVPVVAFDHGAIAERVRRLGGGLLVPPAAGAVGVLRAIRQAVGGPPPATPAPGLLPDPRQAADAHLELYRGLGLMARGSA